MQSFLSPPCPVPPGTCETMGQSPRCFSWLLSWAGHTSHLLGLSTIFSTSPCSMCSKAGFPRASLAWASSLSPTYWTCLGGALSQLWPPPSSSCSACSSGGSLLRAPSLLSAPVLELDPSFPLHPDCPGHELAVFTLAALLDATLPPKPPQAFPWENAGQLGTGSIVDRCKGG